MGAGTTAEGCHLGRDQVIELARRLNTPVGYSFRGKQRRVGYLRFNGIPSTRLIES
jgi:hypothetical protein